MMIRPSGRNTRGLLAPVRLPVALGLALGLALATLPSCTPETPVRRLRIQVVAPAPIVDAEVFLWWVDGDGHPLRRDGRRSREVGLSSENALAQGHTDERGTVELSTGPAHGLVVLATSGGWTRDPWATPVTVGDGGVPGDASPPGSGEPGEPGQDAGASSEIFVAIELRSVLIDFIPGPESSDAVISPLTTLAATIGERRLAHPFKEETYQQAMTRAFAMLGTHFGGIDLTRGPIPTDTDQPLPGLVPTAMHVLALHGLASLAHRIAEASSISGRNFHVLDLLAALLQDASDDRGLLDGMSLQGPVVVGACPMPDSCAVDDAACRPICRLDANTLRARLASALAFDFLPSPLNRTTLSLADVRPFIEHLQTSFEPELFDGSETAELDSPEPVIEVGSSPVFDEREDNVTFDEDAVPIHTPDEDALVDLGQDAACPAVGKHLHRLADPDANALRWQVVMRDRTGWPDSGDSPAALDYRVKLRDPESLPGSGAAGACDIDTVRDPEQAWLTDWLPAQAIGSVDDGGILYEITLLRERVPALATTLQAEFEIVFRGRDALGREAIACRCWNHVLLPVPLDVGEITLATGPGSLAARSLHPGNNLAPLLNGVPLGEAAVLASFLIRNGTGEPAYVRFSVAQPLVQYAKCWHGTNAELFVFDPADPDCISTRSCLAGFPPDRQTLVVSGSGIIEHLVAGLRIQDVTAQTGAAVEICVECDPPEQVIGARTPARGAHTYRVDILVADLSVLAPHTAAEPPAMYFETALAPPHAVPITGVISPHDFHVCTSPFGVVCEQSGIYQYYRSLVTAELSMDDPLSIHVALAPIPHLPLYEAVDVSKSLESFEWNTHEENLPFMSPAPPMSGPRQCPDAPGMIP